MTPFEIILIIIGIICIVISCFFVESTKEETIQDNYADISEQMLMKKVEEATNQMETKIAKARETSVLEADEALSRVSNEKIMAVHEYSDQILKEIDKKEAIPLFYLFF